tara:strand:+ start:68 stop:1000 length:933 start_codon:yes stop_codon:yes gene_type:complete
MGVKLLSKMLKTTCYDETTKIHLSQLYGKKICIDTSIYLYRYKSQGMLIENFYLMCTLFKHYNIIPIFVFDGKPPKSKDKEIENRKEERENAYKEYDILKERYGDNVTKEQEEELNNLKKKMVYISRKDVDTIKNLLDGYGIQYITANGEADVLCASLVLKKRVFAVLTEDMDMFAYTCPNILRYFSLRNHSCIQYNLKKILNKLEISKENFQILCVLSGNDYYNSKKNIFYYMKLYSKFKKIKSDNFIVWLIENNHLSNEDLYDIQHILDMYVNGPKSELSNYKYFNIRYGSVNNNVMMSILEKDRFIF